MSPILKVPRNLFTKGKDDFFSRCQAIGTGQFAGCLFLCLAMYAAIWYQFSKGLGNRIIKAKRMLNMMSMELVLNNELLRERVLSQDITRVLA